MKSHASWLFATLFVLVSTQAVQAQVITNGEIERGLRYRGTSYDGEPWTQRYSYGLNQGFFYLNGSSSNLNYMHYLDRADRAQKFGYPMPIDPYFETPIEQEQVAPPPPPPSARVHFGGGFGIFRRR